MKHAKRNMNANIDANRNVNANIDANTNIDANEHKKEKEKETEHKKEKEKEKEKENTVPSVVFIVPYRGRPQHKYFFANYFKTIVECDTSPIRHSYELYFSHQCDARAFNRGATKNIGFQAVKHKYPHDYQNITFVFNDIDTLPFAPIFDYRTTPGTVKHFYGFQYALGGIVAINGHDFERINGFPNFWGWGMEDNVLQMRCQRHHVDIDRSHFYPIGNPHILHLFDGVQRVINQKDPWRATHDNGLDGLKTIHKLKYSIDTHSVNLDDNTFCVDNPRNFVINIQTFLTATPFETDTYHRYDIREPPRKIIHPNKLRTIHHTSVSVDDWTNIPFYPTHQQKQQMIQHFGQEQTEEIIEQSLTAANPIHTHAHTQTQTHTQEKQRHTQEKQRQTQEKQRQTHTQRQQQTQTQQQTQLTALQRYSANYAAYIGLKPKATASVNIKMGGLHN